MNYFYGLFYAYLPCLSLGIRCYVTYTDLFEIYWTEKKILFWLYVYQGLKN